MCAVGTSSTALDKVRMESYSISLIFFNPLLFGPGNNSYIFPGVALGLLASRARLAPNTMFLIAAKVQRQCLFLHVDLFDWLLIAQECANNVTDDDLAVGRVYPTLERIHEVSHKIAVQVATYAFDHGLALAVRCIHSH
jgi:malate dehydrogenase (oxaloacetate-decarboxylating)(NADP+)